MQSLILSFKLFRASNTKVLFGTVGAVLGYLWLFVEILLYFFPSLETPIRDNGIVVLSISLISAFVTGFIRAWPRKHFSVVLSGTDTSVAVSVMDLFSAKGALVIGTNTTFDTTMDDGLISPKSIQGQFTEKYFPNTSDLDLKITAALDSIQHTTLSPGTKPYGKQKLYSIGTVATVHTNQTTGYLVAMAKLNQHKSANASFEDILVCLPQLWQAIATRGIIGPIFIPLLGTGHGRVPVKRERIIREIVRSYIAASRTSKFCEKLTIVIHPGDYSNNKVDLQSIQEFLLLSCKYAPDTPETITLSSKGQPLT